MTDISDITSETEFDQATLVCTKCGAEYTTFPLRPLRTSDLKDWLDKNAVRFCDCPGTTCDIKFRIKGKIES